MKGNDAPASKGVEVTADHHAKLKHLAPGVTAHDVALAEHRNLSSPPPSDQLAARRKVTAAFYRKNGREYARLDETGKPYGNEASGKAIKKVRSSTRDERKGQLDAIDHNHPVVVGPPPPCRSPLHQWQAPAGDRGSYYADDGVPPEELGIGPEGKSWNEPGAPVNQKISRPHSIDPSTPHLETTAAPADDTWSVPGKSQPAPGGGRQVYIPEGCSLNSTLVA